MFLKNNPSENVVSIPINNPSNKNDMELNNKFNNITDSGDSIEITEKFDFIQPIKDIPKSLKGFPKNLIHIWKDPVNNSEEVKALLLNAIAGIMSPAAMGMDIAKKDNAADTREKNQTTNCSYGSRDKSRKVDYLIKTEYCK